MFKATIHLDEAPVLKQALGATRDETIEWFINVFDFQADLYVIHADNYVLVANILELDKAQFWSLVTSVVCDDNDGTMGQSGLYWPSGEGSRQAFVQLMTTAQPRYLGEYTTEEETGNEQQN